MIEKVYRLDPAVDYGLGFAASLHRPINWFPVVRHQHGEAEGPRLPLPATKFIARPKIPDCHKIPEALRHLLAFDLEMAVVHPEIGHHVMAESRAALRDLVLMMRENEIDAAAVNVNTSPKCFQLIAEHSMCQPGRPRPQGLSQPGSFGPEGFHSTKSIGPRL